MSLPVIKCKYIKCTTFILLNILSKYKTHSALLHYLLATNKHVIGNCDQFFCMNKIKPTDKEQIKFHIGLYRVWTNPMERNVLTYPVWKQPPSGFGRYRACTFPATKTRVGNSVWLAVLVLVLNTLQVVFLNPAKNSFCNKLTTCTFYTSPLLDSIKFRMTNSLPNTGCTLSWSHTCQQKLASIPDCSAWYSLCTNNISQLFHHCLLKPQSLTHVHRALWVM